jgi:hypothetical protein
VLEKSVKSPSGVFMTFCHWDKDWEYIWKHDDAAPEGFPVAATRVARKVLRGVMLGALKDEIRWGTTCVGVEKLEDGKVKVRLSDGNVEECN